MIWMNDYDRIYYQDNYRINYFTIASTITDNLFGLQKKKISIKVY